MGGLAIRIPATLPESKKFLPPMSRNTWFLDQRGIRYLFDKDDIVLNDIPDLSEEEIKSKSKANGLAKTLVCAQALWFVAQCISRRT